MFITTFTTILNPYTMTLHCLHIFLSKDIILWSCFHMQRHCALYFHVQLQSKDIALAVSSYFQVHGLSILFIFPCTRTPSSLHISMHKNCPFHSYFHVQGDCILFTFPYTRTVHSNHTSIFKDTAFSLYYHIQGQSIPFMFSLYKDTAFSPHFQAPRCPSLTKHQYPVKTTFLNLLQVFTSVFHLKEKSKHWLPKKCLPCHILLQQVDIGQNEPPPKKKKKKKEQKPTNKKHVTK